ncbi:hypothetical protein [Blastopirellula marina]|nr:hypothetical protein [Blastopirellula marina]
MYLKIGNYTHEIGGSQLAIMQRRRTFRDQTPGDRIRRGGEVSASTAG